MTAPLRVCLVGPGAIAAEHMRAQAALGMTENAWVVGATVESASSFAGAWQFQHATSDLSAALADPSVDVVLVASPSYLHSDQALLALDAGKHVVVEIPVAMNLVEASKVAQRAHEMDRRVLVCHTMRSYPAFRELRARVRSGAIQVSHVLGFNATPRRYNESWIGGTRDWIDNILWHHACHYVDVGLWVLGVDEARDVVTLIGRANPTFGMAMDISLGFTTQRKQVVSFSLTYNASQDVSHIRFVTDDEHFLVDETRLVSETGIEISPPVGAADLLAQDRAMLTSISRKTSSDYDVDSVLPAMRVLARAQEQEDSRQPC